MSKPRTTPKRYGLVLDLGGAPAQPHVLPGIPHQFRPDHALPVGEGTSIPLATARAWSEREGLPLRLVEMTRAEHATSREQREADLRALRAALPAIREDAADNTIPTAVVASLDEVAKAPTHDPQED